MSILNSTPLLMGDEGYQISRSVRLRNTASAYFNRAPVSASSQTTCTWSGWIKRTPGFRHICFSASISPSGDGNNVSWFQIVDNDTPSIVNFVNGAFVCNLGNTNYKMRDPSAWYHVVFQWNTTNATAALRARVWVNNVEVTLSGTQPAQNSAAWFNTTGPHTIGKDARPGVTNYFDGYITEINFIDGQALDPSSFGEFNTVTGVWQSKKYAGTYGTNGFYLNFSDNSAATAAAIGKDSSGNGNNWTPNNISVTAGVTYDSMIDTPTPYADGGNGRGNYFTLNPLSAIGYTPYSNGNLTYISPGLIAFTSIFSDTRGKWYYEATAESIANANQFRFGFGAIYYANGNIFVGGSLIATVSSYTAGDIIGVATDRDSVTNTVAFYKNGVLQGTYNVADNAGMAISIAAATSDSASFNFGQRPFAYTPPTGFKALNTQNLPASTIENGATQFMAVTRAGTAANYTKTGLAFKPDFYWGKRRDTAGQHVLTDSIRGVTKQLFSSLTNAEQTSSVKVTSFNADGYSLGPDTSGTGDINSSATGSYVDWLWKAGGTAVTNTAGSISSQVSANVSAGFSVVTWTGTGAAATIGHGLGVAPKMIILKVRTSATNWVVWNERVAALSGASYFLQLNLTAAAASDATYFQSTAPTSSVFSVGFGGGQVNASAPIVAYCFSEVAGYSKFGSYTGNGSADGPFVYLGFRPKFVMVKRTDAVGSFWMLDTSRDTYNLATKLQRANETLAEETSYASIDILSNGFKVRVTSTESNASGGTYIYMAFAEVGFKYALGR